MIRDPRRLAVREVEHGDADSRLAEPSVVRFEPVDRAIEESLQLGRRADGLEPVGGLRRGPVRTGEAEQQDRRQHPQLPQSINAHRGSARHR